jgi:hypothetical protein
MGWFLTLLVLAGAAPNPAAAVQDPIRIGVIAGPLGSFAATILPSLQIDYARISDQTPSDSLLGYHLLIVDNLFRLQDLNGPAFKAFVEGGGVLLVINPKADGFSRTWAPYDVFIGEPTREARIVEKKHPIFDGFSNDRIHDLANSNGPFVGNCSFTEPAKEWTVLARHKDKKNNAVILEAVAGRGRIILACTRFDQFNARAVATRLGENLFRYAIAMSERSRGR